MRGRGEQPQRPLRTKPRRMRGHAYAVHPKLRIDSFFPEDDLERFQLVDRALADAAAEMYATDTSTRKVKRAAKKIGVSRLSKDQVSAIASSLDTDVENPCARPLDGSPVPFV